jgi:aspartate/methionine/tyrosine aminotransferase
VAVPVPGYPLIEPLARFAGVRTVGYPLFYVHPHGWVVDTGVLADVLGDPSVRAVVAVSPGNPTGAYVEPEASAVIAHLCARHGAMLIADEVFAPFWLDRHGAAPSLDGCGAGVAVLDGLSKSLAAPGVKAAWMRLCGPVHGELRPAIDAVADAHLSVSSLVGAALPDLLRLVPSQVERVRERLTGNLAHLRDVAGAVCRVRRVDGGWTALVDLPRVRGDDEWTEHLMRAGVAVQPGWLFDLQDTGAVAVSLLAEPERFARGCARLRAAVDCA